MISSFCDCPVTCNGGVFDEPEGHLTSPGFPDPPPHALSCQYTISVEPGFNVSLNFSDSFQIESMETEEEGLSCPYHWLQVKTDSSQTQHTSVYWRK